MKKLREVLRLHFECRLSNRKIAKALSLSPTTVGNYLQAASRAELAWETILDLNEAALIECIEPHCPQLTLTSRKRKAIDLVALHNSLKKKGVTRELLHKEYLENSDQLNPVSYTEFCRQYRDFTKKLKPSMRQTHQAGEKIFVDYAGPTIPIYDAQTGEIFTAVIFVGVLGASNFTYAEATRTRSLPDWLGSHSRMFEYFAGVSELVVPDNEKSGVTKACYYDPDVNPNYAALAAHYGTAVLPARPHHPKDKAKVEVAVQIVERWILAKLRHRKFFSLAELNQAISLLLEELNNKPFKKLPGTRRLLYETLDKPALKPLPCQPYEFVVIKYAQVNLDYHVEIDNHYYSVPHHLIGQRIEYHLGENTITILHHGKHVVSHLRSHQKSQSTTITQHRPVAHQRHQQWTPTHFLTWSQTVGSCMEHLASYLIQHKPHPECCYRIQLGFMNLAKRYNKTRLEEACQYAVARHLMSYSHVKSILQTQVDKAPLQAVNDDLHPRETESCQHKNLRGADYYSKN